MPSDRQREYEKFGRKVKQAYDDPKQRYGATKICRILNNSGTPCSIKRVQRHMAAQNLRYIVVKKYNHHANHGTVPDGKGNILKRDFEAETNAYGTSMTADLAVEAVKNACLNIRNTREIILHSDLGIQYTSQAFEACLNSMGMLHSFSRKGNPYDNACIESFHSVLKKEEIYLHTYRDSNEARRAIFEYIEGWYNCKRIHSAIGYLTSQQKEDEELKKAA